LTGKKQKNLKNQKKFHFSLSFLRQGDIVLINKVGSGLAYSAYPVAKNKVELQLPFNETELQSASSPTSRLILKLDPTQVTFNDGRGKLNTDGDTKPGEAEEDFFRVVLCCIIRG
jgi:hypothetical protein